MMKREILFRGKSVSHGSFEYGDLITSFNGVYIGNTLGNSPDDWCKVTPESVGQFTGLLDKNGDKIFEGDVLNTKTTFENNMADRRFQDKTLVEVVFSNGAFIDANTDTDLFSKIRSIVSKKIEFEIIGNIHDNPELV